jgi:hypothetical protein
MNKISEVTRRNIFDFILLENISWSGRLDEPAFLCRIFDLSKLSSTDGRFEDARGDIWQHRVNNFDWDDSWIIADDRFNLLHCEDAVFLQFLCEMLHPIVRPEISEVTKLLQLFNEQLLVDGYEIIEKTKVSGRPIFSARQKFSTNSHLLTRSAEIANVLSGGYITQKINRMEVAIENDPALAIGTAKELIETMCITILKNRGIEVNKAWDAPKLLNETAKALKLTPKEIPDAAAASQTIKSILGSLFTVVHGICELRNSYGTGHGKEAKFKGLTSRHAKLAVGAASTLAIFLFETHEIKAPD